MLVRISKWVEYALKNTKHPITMEHKSHTSHLCKVNTLFLSEWSNVEMDCPKIGVFHNFLASLLSKIVCTNECPCLKDWYKVKVER